MTRRVRELTVARGTLIKVVALVAMVGLLEGQICIPVDVDPLAVAISGTAAAEVGSGTTLTATATGGSGTATFAWSVTSGDATLSATSGSSVTVTCVSAGDSVVSVTATDEAGTTATATSTVTCSAAAVTPDPLAVTATADDTTPDVGDTIALLASASNGTPPYTYSWSQTSATAGATIANATSQTPSVTFSSGGSFTFQVMVTDAAAGTATGTVDITASGTSADLILTTSTDSLTGTSGDDTFDGSLFLSGAGVFVNTLQSADSINGAEGTDTLMAQNTGGGTVTPASLASIEVLDIELTTANALTINANNADSLTTVIVRNPPENVIVQNIGTAITAASVLNGDDDVTITVDDADLTGASDTLTLTLEGMTDAGAEPIVTVQPDAVANGFDTLNVVSQGSSDNGIQQLTDGNGTSLTTLNISGSAGLTVGAELDASAQTIDGSSATGNLVLAPNSTGANTTITGGTGDDTFDFSTAANDYSTADTIDGGDGTDTLLLDDADATAGAVAQTNVSNIEVIEVDTAGGGDVDITFFGATMFKSTTAGFGANTLTIPDGGTVELDFDPGGNMTIASKTSGTTNTFTLQMDANMANNFVLTSWEGVTITANNAAVTITGTVALNSSAATETITATGSQALTLTGAVTADALDASGLSGALTMGAAPVASMTITGTPANDTLLGADVDATGDNITGGAGVDRITGADGNDIVTGGDGADEFVFGATAVANNNDIISDFTTSDVLVLDAFATDDAPLATYADTSTGLVATATNDVIIITDADGSIDTAAEVAALWGTVLEAAIVANDQIVLLIQDTQASGSTAIWYMDDTGNTAVAAGECVQVATLSGFNGTIADANIED